MGNRFSLKRYFNNRRRNKTIESRSRSDHPEQLYPDNLSTISNTEQISSVLSTTPAMTSMIMIPMEATIQVEVKKEEMITSEAQSVTIKPVETNTTIGIEPVTIPITDVETSNKCSDFYLACRTNNTEEVKRFLRIIEVEEIDRLEPNGSTALHTACYHGYREIVELLLRAGADRSLRNKFRYLPFDEAANNEIRQLFHRVPNTNRIVSNTGAVE